MADGGEEGGFGLVGLLCLVAGAGQFALGVLALGDVAAGALDFMQAAIGPANGRFLPADPAPAQPGAQTLIGTDDERLAGGSAKGRRWRLADKTLAGGEIHFRAEGPAQGLLLRGAEGLAEDIVDEGETSGHVAAEDDVGLAVDQPTQAIKLRMDRGRLAAVTRQTIGEAAQGRGARSANGGQQGGSHGARVSGYGGRLQCR